MDWSMWIGACGWEHVDMSMWMGAWGFLVVCFLEDGYGSSQFFECEDGSRGMGAWGRD